MFAGCRSKHGGSGNVAAGRLGRMRGLCVALLAGLCAFALPVAPAFGEGSVDTNTGPGTAYRNNLTGLTAAHNVLKVYARAGETIQMASSAQNIGGGTILLYPPGSNVPADSLPGGSIENCAGQGGAGYMGTTRAAELAGPAPPGGDLDPNTYTPCEFTATVDGIYEVVMLGPDPTSPSGGGGTVNSPIFLNDPTRQEGYVAMWDITVRDAAAAKQPGRVFTNAFNLKSVFSPNVASDWQSYVYTSTGYEYRTSLSNPAGLNWVLRSDSSGALDDVTGDPIFASTPSTAPVHGDGNIDSWHSLFVSSVDPLVISGPGGLGETRGYEAAPITPASDPLKNLAFAGSAGQAGVTNRGSGGTISFDSPAAMDDLFYTLALDLNNDGVYGNDGDVTNTSRLSSAGNSFAWNGTDSTGATPACGSYPYHVTTSLSDVHFLLGDMEGFGGMTIERLTLPTDASLPGPFAASYNDINPYPPGGNVSGASPAAVTNGDSSVAGFHAWAYPGGDNDYIDTYSRLPEIVKSGTLRVLCADPQIVKTTDPSPVVPGEDVTYSLTVKNNGPDTATNLRVVDKLPSKVSFVSAGSGCAEASKTVTCTLGSLAAGASHTFKVTGHVASSADSCADVRNAATVTNDVPDTDLTNNSSSVCDFERRADPSIIKVPSRTQVPTGGQVMYTLVVKNNGPSDDDNVRVSDPMAAGLSLMSAKPGQGSCSTAGGKVSCNLGHLEAGGSTQILVTAQVTATSGCVTNTATVSGDAKDTNPNNNKASAKVCVAPGPEPKFDLVVAKTASSKSVYVGQPLTYTVTVTNRGPAAAPNAKVTDTLNHPASVVSVKSTQGSCTTKIPMTCKLGTVPAGGKVTITVVVKLRDNGCKQRNAASATGEGTDTNPADNLARVDVCAKAVPLRLTKVADSSSVRAGGLVGYTIRVSNPTSGEAQDVQVCDKLPSGLVYVSSKAKAKFTKGQYCWQIDTLAAHQSRSFRITVRALGSASGNRVNRATASAPGATTKRAKDPVRVLGARASGGGVTG
jgi:uncharacterized repeat protein (TIGR01451 family)